MIKITVEPIIAKGRANKLNSVAILCSIVPISLASKLVNLPSCEDFIVYEEILDILAYKSMAKPLFILDANRLDFKKLFCLKS